MLKHTHSPFGQKYQVSEGRSFQRPGTDPGWWRDATCAEVDCPHYLLGWTTVVPTSSAQAEYIRRRSGRRFIERRDEEAMSAFHFEPGQRCFGRIHRVKIGRPPLYLRNGELIDWDRWFGEFNEDFEKSARR